MKYLRKFDSVADMESTIQGSSISFMGLAYNNGTPVVGNKVVPPTPPAQYTVTCYIMDAITGSEADYGTISGLSGSYAPGSTVTLTAIPNSGYSFVQWYTSWGAEPTTTTLTFTINENVEVYALFQEVEVQYSLTATISPMEAASVCYVEGTGTWNRGENPTLTAHAESPYTFDHWEINGVTVGTADTYTILGISDNTDVTAVFRYIPQ